MPRTLLGADRFEDGRVDKSRRVAELAAFGDVFE
jgi:hypothetical protein